MRILGIDPGTARIGWAVIETNGGRITIRGYGCLETPAGDTPEHRLLSVFNQTRSLISTHKPDEVSMEDLFFATNAKTAIQVGQARGVLLLAAAMDIIPVASYSPLSVKLTICGDGKAEKKQVEKMVTRLLQLPAPPKPDDTADALAIALTHAWSWRMKRVESARIQIHTSSDT